MKQAWFKGDGRKWPRIFLAVVVLVVVLAVGATVMVRKIYNDSLQPVSGSQQSKIIDIEVGTPPSEIASLLEEEGLIRESWAFEWYIRSQGLRDSLQAGTYSLKPSLSTQQIADILTQGKIATDLVTILPGKRLDEIRDSLINDGFDAKAVDAALDPERYRDHPALVDKPRDASLEGYLYPETFHKTAATDPATIIKLSLDEMHKRLTPDIRAGIVKRGLTVHEGVILASIVEKEAGREEDKPKIAQVFIKRLKDGMKLESDPTSIYGAIKDEIELPNDSSQAIAASIRHNSSYNTYSIEGLPPGPISNISEGSLKAIVNPANTDFLFFVSDSDCNTRFSRTLSEHESLIDRFGVCKQ